MKRAFVLFLALFGVLSLTVSMVSAETLTFSGTITTGNPILNPIAQVAPPVCAGNTYPAPVFYHTETFTVAETGVYSINGLTGEEGIYIHVGSFDPANPVANCHAATVDAVQISPTLTAGTTYVMVVWENYFVQDGMTYNFTLEGPAQQTPEPTQEVTPEPTQEVTPEPTSEVTPEPEVTDEPTPEMTPDLTDEPTEEPIVVPTGTPVPVVAPPQPCLYPFPTGASIYFVPQGAPTFYQPNLETQNSFNLPAGTWYITELDDEDDFAKVWIACRAAPVYIPVNAIDIPVAADAE